jgi:hypothetical protein
VTDNTNTIDSQIMALLERSREDAFRAGWDAAITSVVTAATNIAPQGTKVVATSGIQYETQHLRRRAPMPGDAPNRAPWGLAERALNAAIERAGSRGIDFDGVREMAREMEGHDLAETSVRSACLKRERRGELVRRNGRWFPPAKIFPESAGSAHEATPADPLFHNQGGPNGTALADP